MQDRIVKLEGRTVVFPDGNPGCLACGNPVAGTRPVAFEPVGDVSLTQAGKLLSHLNAIQQRVQFDAPLCEAHLLRAKSLARKAPLHFCAAVILLMGAVVTLLSFKLVEKSKASLLLGAPGVVWLMVALQTWQAKDRAGLPCEAIALEDDNVLLKYPEST